MKIHLNISQYKYTQKKLTVTRSSDAHLVLSVSAQTGQATARALGAGTEPVPRLETRSTRHRTLTPGSPH